MASGHVKRAKQAERIAVPTTAATVRKAFANPEPSTDGSKQKLASRTGFLRNGTLYTRAGACCRRDCELELGPKRRGGGDPKLSAMNLDDASAN